jgi:glycosyltransferase involved in cell wall biosynthesis
LRSEELVVYTTWYSGLDAVIEEWGRSVKAQTDTNFELVVGVDGVSPEPWVARMDLHQRVRWFSAPGGASPARVRQVALQRIVEQASAVVFVDSDDILDESRVAAAREGLAGAEVVACGVRLADATGRILGGVLGPSDGPDPVTDLPYHNVFGLSNTAYRSATLRACLPIPDDCVLIDWLLATRAWGHRATMMFDTTPRMTYRQGAESPTRVSPPYTEDQVLKATDLVLGHYALVLRGARALPAATAAALESAHRRAVRFRNIVSGSREMLSRYVEALNRLAPRYVWWWAVANPELENLWTT